MHAKVRNFVDWCEKFSAETQLGTAAAVGLKRHPPTVCCYSTFPATIALGTACLTGNPDSRCVALQSALDPPGMQPPVMLMLKPLQMLNLLATISDNNPAPMNYQ
jgi:hypothetical protein